MLKINKNNLNFLDIYLTWGGGINFFKPISNKLLQG